MSLTNVAGNERDQQLFGLGALGSRLGHDMLVESLDGSLEAREFHHSIGDLSHPEWWKALIESAGEKC